jgi:hypothetical protein
LVVECKHYKSLINWEKRNSKGKLESYCAKYFFEDKYQFLIDKGYSKNIKLLFVSSSGFTKGAKKNIEKLDNSLAQERLRLAMTALDLVDFCKDNNIGIKDQKDWLNRYYIRANYGPDLEDYNDIDFELNEETIDSNELDF